MKTKRITAFLLSLVLVVAAGCGGGGGNVRQSMPERTPTEPTVQPKPVARGGRLPFPITDIAFGAPAQLFLAYAGYRERLDKTIVPPSTGRFASTDDALHSPITFSARDDGQGNEEPLVFVGVDQGSEDWEFINGVQQTREGLARCRWSPARPNWISGMDA